ncbi:MAG: hypothetical protein GWN71_11175 [Gammaproteobacteria bacterium]|nr:hypothetical protein [Gemmatimonadota bacterium]NIU74118.1 hypothetical protein [Gammaproteobacteria bacterium]
MDTCVYAALAGVVLGSALGAGIPARTLLRLLGRTGNGEAGRVADALQELSAKIEAERPDGDTGE